MTTQTAKQAVKTAEKIMAIRAATGNPCTVCPTCGHTPENPYRRGREGKIVEGCIDACHTGRLQPISSTLAWHERDEARSHRRDVLAALEDL